MSLPSERPDLKVIDDILLGLDPTWAHDTLREMVAWLRHIEQDVESLERIRAARCAYGSGPNGPCDCKYYNPKHHSVIASSAGPKGGGEYTGCAELRQVIEHLQGKATWGEKLSAKLGLPVGEPKVVS